MRIDRLLDQQIKDHFLKYKQILLLLGARQVGKTTLLKRVFPEAVFLLVDNEPVRRALETYDVSVYKQIIAPKEGFLVIDEIHKLSDPGRAAKIIYDEMPGVKLIVTGSSSLNIKNKTTESLAGRKIQYELFPLAFSEYLYQKGIEKKLNDDIFDLLTFRRGSEGIHLFDLSETLETVLLYGLYPGLLQRPRDRRYLENLADSVIFKDILDLGLIENRRSALDLLKLLAYQIGNLVNYSEIGNRLNIDTRTVKKYIEIFEESSIIFRVFPYSTNKRDEIGKSPKIYFWDTGLRNALIRNFETLLVRVDRGALFENFMLVEAKKANSYKNFPYNINYYRTTKGSEVDLVLNNAKEIFGIEIKYLAGKVNKAFLLRYPSARIKLVTAENFY